MAEAACAKDRLLAAIRAAGPDAFKTANACRAAVAAAWLAARGGGAGDLVFACAVTNHSAGRPRNLPKFR